MVQLAKIVKGVLRWQGFLDFRLVAFRINAKVAENMEWLKGPSRKENFHLFGKMLCSNVMESITVSLTV